MVSRMFRPPPLGRLRLASVEDAPFVLELLNDSMSNNFRVHCVADVVYLIENCVLSICQLDITETIVGFLAARDYPLIPSVHPSAWEEYIWTKYKAVELNPRNTLFLHLICWNTIYSREIVDSMLKSVFMHDPYVQHIAVVKSLVNYPLFVPGQSRCEASFRRVQTMERGIPGDLLPALCIADRSEVSPRLRIRRAVEEDNDDIVPIIEAHSPKLRDLYGEFYVSELISRHPESERVLLVCEHKEVAVGVMCLNTQINYAALEENFELSPFAGLRKLDQAPLKTETEVDSIASITRNSMANQRDSGIVSPPRDMKSRVTWLYDDDEFKDIRTVIKSTMSTPASAVQVSAPAQLDILNLLEDDDELEYDIVNIDLSLLTVPKYLSYDNLERGPAENIKKILSGKSKEVTDETPKKEKVRTASKAPEPTRYSGSPNAFLLELFAMHCDYDERYGFDMLEAAYELFPDRDYCVICLPSNHASFPLLEHFTLVTAYSSRIRFINETLYVAHVNSIRGDLKVRRGEAADRPALIEVLEHDPHSHSLIDLFESTLTSHKLYSYVMLSENQPVGLVILGPLEDGTAVRTHFDLEPEPRRAGTDGTILTGVVSSVVEPHSRWFMRELLRQSHFSTLFWICRLFAKGDANPSKHLMSLAGHMTPVHPRHSIPNISRNPDLDQIFKDMATPFALWVLERPLSSLPKVYVNNSIVVVGASRTGLAFLETLFLGPTSQYLTFSNVTLVSEHGLPTVAECLRAADTCVPRDGRYTDRYLKSVPFYFYLDVMSAVMVGIDRKKKCIHLKGGGVKYYDELVLTCGQQFQHPDYLHESLELVKEVELGKPCDRILMDNPKYEPDRVPIPPEMPDNVMVVNSLFEANVYLRKLLCMISEAKETSECLNPDNPVIVYGDCIEAYSCIAALLELGISSEMIVFVEPFPPEDPAKLRVNCFNNETVDERVQENLENLGIRVYRKYYLMGWRQQGNHVDNLHLMSQLQAICFSCFALFYYGLKAIDIYAFKAINESGLVYDGGLVVGTSFETNDPNVFGAGTCIKYSRRLYASSLAHKYYCSEDVGEALAKLFLNKLDPFIMGNPDCAATELLPRFSSSLLAFKADSLGSISSACRWPVGTAKRIFKRLCATDASMFVLSIQLCRWQPVPKFESPIVQAATLPGPLYYMKLRKPGMEIPMEVQMCLPHQGHTLVTDKNESYFQLQLNVLHCVDAVTCLSRKLFSSEVLSQLYGKHEAFFNKLLTRYQMGRIDDLYSFFTQPWLAAIYQETFAELLKDINEQDVGTVHELVKSKFTLREEEIKSTKSLNTGDFPIHCDVPDCGFGPKEPRTIPLGTFRSVIDRFVAGKSSVMIDTASKPTDIPSECGQSSFIRGEAAGFWKSVGGERLVMAHLAQYLNRNSVSNPHYSVPKTEFI